MEPELWCANLRANRQWADFVASPLEKLTPARMSTQGAELLAEGRMSDVYGLGGVAIKICRRDNRPSERFIRLALNRQQNPFYPQILAVGFHGDRHVVVMERLEGAELSSSSASTLFFASRCHHHSIRCAPHVPEVVAARRQNLPAFRQLFRDLRQLGQMRRYCLHPQNIMRRDGDGQLVITDPIC